MTRFKKAATIAALFAGIFSDIKNAVRVVPSCWTLYVIMLVLLVANLFIFFDGISVSELFFRLANYTALSVFFLIFILIIAKILEKKKETTEDIARVYIFYWTLSRISLLVDGLMIGIIKRFGIWIEIPVIVFLFFVICVWNIYIYDSFAKKGQSIINPNNFQGKISSMVLKNRATIFWMGSLWLEPDVVTILLRKKEAVWKSNLRITFPSVVWCISFWSLIFYLGIKGYAYFQYFVQ